MILLFLGSWRSTLIVCLSIPLSILTSLIVLGFLGQTINVMTLGGLALAVGILVDDATVEIENVHRNMGMRGKTLVRAILDGAQQIAVPAFVSTLCICIVFVPVLMLSGAAKYLFTPLAMAVVFAMLTSYLLTRTMVPTLVHYLLPRRWRCIRRARRADRLPDRRARSGGSTRRSTAVSKDSAHAYRGLLSGCWHIALDHRRSLRRICRSPSLGLGRCSSDRISFPMWTPDRCGCMCAAPPGLASKRRSASSPPSRPRFAV